MNSEKPSKTKRATIISNAINDILKIFKSGNFPQAVAMSIIHKHSGDNIPSDSWSLANRLLMVAQDTSDARGFRHWQQVNRQVKKGAKAIHIFSPIIKTLNDTDNKTGEDVKKNILIGFSTIPVFRYEDTEGEDLPFYDYSPKTYPPFFDVAEKLDIEVSYKPLRGNFYGQYNISNNDIILCSDSAVTYYHELAHAIDHKVNGDLRNNDKSRNEIVAEFSAIVLCQLSGISGYEDQSYQYIREYCKHSKTDAAILKKIMGILADVEKIIDTVLAVSEGESKNEQCA